MMIKKTLKVQNSNGLHMWNACKIAEISKNSNSKVILSCDSCKYKKADGCSIIDILSFGAAKGEDISLTVKGDDENNVIKRIEAVFTDGSRI